MSVEKSRAEIEYLLSRYGASAFAYAVDGERAMLQFRVDNRMVRMMIRLPDRTEKRFACTKIRKSARSKEDAHRAWEQECRRLWRSLALLVKAKLEACASKISTVEREFLADILLPDGGTVGERLTPQLEAAYTNGRMPALLGMAAEEN